MTDRRTTGRDREPPYFGDDLDRFDVETGLPGIMQFGNAVQLWAIQQDRPVTVREAALAFNCPDAMIREAVEEHYWLDLGGPDDDPTKQTIEHEGE